MANCRKMESSEQQCAMLPARGLMIGMPEFSAEENAWNADKPEYRILAVFRLSDLVAFICGDSHVAGYRFGD